MLWTGMGHCPFHDCHFTISLEAADEADLDMAAMAAFEAHVRHTHPGEASVMLHGHRQSPDDDMDRPKLMN